MTMTREQAIANSKKMAEMRAAGWKPLNPVEKYKANPKSLRAMVNAYCWTCCGEQRAEVSRCHITGCTLWAVRPWQKQAASDTL